MDTSQTSAQQQYLQSKASVTNIYKPAPLDNFELGLKGVIAHVFTFGTAVFYAKGKDQAITNSVAVPNATADPRTLRLSFAYKL